MKTVKMLYYDWIDISERIDVNKTSELKECNIAILVFFRWRFYVSTICMQ